jgi:soluble lytic murein transglycosylase
VTPLDFIALFLHDADIALRMRERERCVAVRLTTALLLVACFALCGLSRAQAWSDAPLCVAQPPQLSEYVQLESSELVCSPDDVFSIQRGPLWTVQQGPLWTAPITAAEARRALKDAGLLAERAPADALLKLRLVERAMPRIQDRLAKQRGDLLLRLGRSSEACEAYRQVTESPQSDVAADGRIAYVRCLFLDGRKEAEAELDRICRRYPRLPERFDLQVMQAQWRERMHNVAGAVQLYRSIDLQAPETGAADDARAALDRLRADGVKVAPYTPQEIVERAGRMLDRGPLEAGRRAINDLLAMSDLPALQRGRAHILAARLARMEGNYDVVRDEVAKAIAVGIGAADAQRFLPRASAERLDPDQGEALIHKVTGGRQIKKLRIGQLRGVLDLGWRYGLPDVTSEALDAMTAAMHAGRLDTRSLFDAAVVASGVAYPESELAAFECLRDVHGIRAASTYYHARALEELGRVDEARAEYHTVIDIDDQAALYYTTWAQSRLSGFEQLAANSCKRDVFGKCEPDTALSAPANAPSAPPQPSAANSERPEVAVAPPGVSAVFGNENRENAESIALPNKNDVRRDTIVARLRTLASEHGEAYPWFARAADLVELDRYDDAASEISEAYLAYRDARGGQRMRVGAEAVLTNATQPIHAMTGNVRRLRLALDDSARMSLAEVADMLGEPGVSWRLRDNRNDYLPRAYEADVNKAAAKFGVDPNLLLAVMRVESVFYRDIVSFAGAVGLMQIMPHTGLRIARALGIRDFNTRELLDPRRNLEFAAWYLASLIKRFDGRVPLAVAAYNGGPHNVRLWLNAHPDSMPLDAFLERIPFHETHRYVRRVLASYAAYRAQKNLPMINLAVSVPKLKPDTIAF